MAAHDEQVEKVARAIYETASGPWEFVSDYGQDIVRREARAAIAAMGDGWPPISPELIDKLGKLATYLTEQGEYEACDLIDTVVDRLGPAQGDGWRDIASAPRDGTRVLLMLRGPKPPETIARWDQEWTTEEGDDAFEWVNDEDDAIYGTPTHWAPLPPPPGAKP